MDIEPSIWRRVLVPANLTLGELHDVIQISMGWLDSHLHQFRQGEAIYSDPKFELDEDPSITVIDERKVKLNKVFSKPSDALVYEYDFGDDWRHLIEFEKIVIKTEDISDEPTCVEGQRSCPLEDSGGAHGYTEKLAIIKDDRHPLYQEYADWVPDGFNPEYFNLRQVNFFLYKVFGG